MQLSAEYKVFKASLPTMTGSKKIKVITTPTDRLTVITEHSEGDRQEMREKPYWEFLKMKRILGRLCYIPLPEVLLDT